MKTTLLDLFTSKKFLAALSAIIIYLAGRFGFDVDPAALDRIFAALLVYVGAQGVADVGKSAAQIKAVAGSAPLGEASAAMSRIASTVGVLAILLLGLGATTALPACHYDTVKADTTALAHGAVTCAKADLPAIEALGIQLTTEALVSALAGHGVPWPQLEAEAEAGAKVQGIAVGSCAFGQLIADLARLLPAHGQGIAARADDGRAELAALKARLGVAKIRLGSGEVL